MANIKGVGCYNNTSVICNHSIAFSVIPNSIFTLRIVWQQVKQSRRKSNNTEIQVSTLGSLLLSTNTDTKKQDDQNVWCLWVLWINTPKLMLSNF